MIVPTLWTEIDFFWKGYRLSVYTHCTHLGYGLVSFAFQGDMKNAMDKNGESRYRLVL